MKHFTDIDEVASLNRSNSGHFFDEGATRYFGSRYHGVYGCFFVTSEKRRGEARWYTVRRYNAAGEIHTIDVPSDDSFELSNGFQHFRTAALASKYAKLCAQAWEEHALEGEADNEALAYLLRCGDSLVGKLRAINQDCNAMTVHSAAYAYGDLDRAIAYLAQARKLRLKGKIGGTFGATAFEERAELELQVRA